MVASRNTSPTEMRIRGPEMDRSCRFGGIGDCGGTGFGLAMAHLIRRWLHFSLYWAAGWRSRRRLHRWLHASTGMSVAHQFNQADDQKQNRPSAMESRAVHAFEQKQTSQRKQNRRTHKRPWILCHWRTSAG